jgi:DNA polymerase-3 subunit epsilon
MLLDAPLAIVDLETTGTRPAIDRITEIAVLEVDGFEVTAEWSTLVNPGNAIPPEIEALTGITREMVAGAPRFGELAGELYERLAGRVFVAHNARFDYGFLRREFDRAGLKFHARTLCSVKLARRLYPGLRHDLDSLIERHGIRCRARHRALGDAEALWQFLRLAAREHGEEILAVAARQVARQPALPPYIDRASVDAIPEAPGVYLFYGEGPAPLYVGHGKTLRSRVLEHLSSKTPRLARQVRRIEWQRTAGELGALLREASLVRELDPVFNRQLRRPRQFEPADWPHRGPLGILETDPARDATEVHVVDRWCYLGTASCDPEVAELLEAREPRFDYDHYRILARHLRKRGVRVVQLGY